MNRSTGGRPPRALFYSHDTLGLGHLRRTLLLCEGLGEEFSDLSTLVVTGSAMAHAFRMPPGVDYVKLPCVRKIDNEHYASRSLRAPFETTFNLRQEIIFHTTVHYQPDFFFVDNVPLGMQGELLTTLEHIKNHMPATRVLLGLRDILDDRRHIVPLWRRTGVLETLDKFYDRIFIYGLPAVFDPIVEYDLPEHISRKARFCGYIPRRVDKEASKAARRELCAPGQKMVLVTVGGGSDGEHVVDNYLRALPRVWRETDVTSLVLLGPEMDLGCAARLASHHADPARTRFMEYCDDPLPYMDASDLVVSMAGYNTISEILALRKKAIAVPRVQPRTEQLIRSQRLQDLGLLRMIHPEELSPQRLANEMIDCLNSPASVQSSRLEFTAFEKLTSEMHSLLEGAA